MEQDLRQKIFGGLRLSLATNHFDPRKREFALSILKVGEADLTNLEFRLHHLPTKTEMMVALSETLVFSQGNLIQVDIFPEMDALFQRLGIYDHTRTRVLQRTPIQIEARCSWMNVHSGSDSTTLSFVVEPDPLRPEQLEWVVHA
jgi:hypothetical protein